MRFLLGVLIGLLPCCLKAASGIAFFEQKIRPVLAKHCYECHSAQAAKKGKIKSGLQLDTRTGVQTGGERGSALKLIVSALRQDGELKMPPSGKLSDLVIADFQRWIEMGAPDPRDGEMVEVVQADDFEKAREFWSFRPVRKSARPEVKDKDWPRSELDWFVAYRREAKDLRPAGYATKRTLIRRLYFDLVGLPPSPDELSRWVEADSRDLVDELLASPHFGERWGRHWLDVARYADSNGRARNVLWHHAWRYRDWVIKAFNDDLPFNEFVKHQVAGDLLPAKGRERDDMIVAAGLLALGPKAVEERRTELFTMDVIDEQIDVITRGFMGLSVSCARCHDHKFDPVPTKDYYSLAGILLSTKTQYGYGPPHNWNINNDTEYQPIGPHVEERLPQAAEYREKVIAKIRERGKARSDRYRVVRRKADSERKLKKVADDAKKELNASIKKMAAEIEDWDERIKKMEEELEALQADVPPQPGYAMSVREKVKPEDCRVYIRGEVTTPGKKVARGNLRFLDLAGIKPISEGESGRRQLAEWIAHEKNPLTPRVFVNRVWQQLFGRGLVTTPDDFGKTGAKPSHPQLMDHLAAEFIDNDWSVKNLIRSIVLSRTYQMASEPDGVNQSVDPENEWLWRMSPRRLQAEPFRDAVLAVSGQLDRKPRARSVIAEYQEFKEFEFNSAVKLTQEQMRINHRSVYLPIVRGNLPELLDLFDFADPDSLAGKRDETTVPAQSLYLMNGEWIIEQAKFLAQRLEELPHDGVRVNRLFQLAYARPPSPVEKARTLRFVHDDPERWHVVCQSVLASTEFRVIR
ncbi:MAG: DUF1553 domain-containing protein [Limisphaerales bacterium]